MKSCGRLQNGVAGHVLFPYFGSRHGLAVGFWAPHSEFHFHNNPPLIRGWRVSQERRGEKGEVKGGWAVVWWAEQTHCHTKTTPTPSSALAQPCIPATFPSAPLGNVKPPQTGSGSSVPASSGHCWGSSFDGLLTSHRSSGCHCEHMHDIKWRPRLRTKGNLNTLHLLCYTIVGA